MTVLLMIYDFQVAFLEFEPFVISKYVLVSELMHLLVLPEFL